MNDILAKKVEALWKQYFPDASILPVIGYPSYKNQGVMTLTHSMGGPMLKIDGLVSKSPLSNNALYSAEVSNGHWINLYEIMIPDVPGKNGSPSTTAIYLKALAKNGLTIESAHYHWSGSSVIPEDKGVTAIHHSGLNMDPMTFTSKTINAINEVMNYLK